MSAMSELHNDLETIHNILLGQRKVAQDLVNSYDTGGESEASIRVQCIDDLLLEFEAAGIEWPDNVVEPDRVGALRTFLGWDKAPANEVDHE